MKKIAMIVCVALAVTLTSSGVYAGELQASPRVSDEQLKARVQAVLLSALDVPGKEMTVAARGGVVTLTGRVSTPTEQQSVGAIVRAVPGVKDVRFSIRIEPARPAPPAGSGDRGAAPGAR